MNVDMRGTPKNKTIHFDVLTLFPKILDSYFNESVLKRGQAKKLIAIKSHDIRDFTNDKHNTTDDTPYGGGAGMVLKAEPILKAVAKVIKETKVGSGRRKILIMSAKGQQFAQNMAADYAKKYDQLIIIVGRFEGIDERVKTILKAEEISLGPFVMTDGDVAAMAVVSAVARLVPGVIKSESLQEESHSQSAVRNPQSAIFVEYPHYTRPEVITWRGKKYRVPKVLLSGNHNEINRWRHQQRKILG